MKVLECSWRLQKVLGGFGNVVECSRNMGEGSRTFSSPWCPPPPPPPPPPPARGSVSSWWRAVALIM